MWAAKVEQNPERFDEYRPFILMLNAKAAYADGRELVDSNFVKLLEHCLRQVDGRRDARLREAVLRGISRLLQRSPPARELIQDRQPAVGPSSIRRPHATDPDPQARRPDRTRQRPAHRRQQRRDAHRRHRQPGHQEPGHQSSPTSPAPASRARCAACWNGAPDWSASPTASPLGFRDIPKLTAGPATHAAKRHPEALRRRPRGRPGPGAGARDRPDPSGLLGLQPRSGVGRGDGRHATCC